MVRYKACIDGSIKTHDDIIIVKSFEPLIGGSKAYVYKGRRYTKTYTYLGIPCIFDKRTSTYIPIKGLKGGTSRVNTISDEHPQCADLPDHLQDMIKQNLENNDPFSKALFRFYVAFGLYVNVKTLEDYLEKCLTSIYNIFQLDEIDSNTSLELKYYQYKYNHDYASITINKNGITYRPVEFNVSNLASLLRERSASGLQVSLLFARNINIALTKQKISSFKIRHNLIQIACFYDKKRQIEEFKQHNDFVNDYIDKISGDLIPKVKESYKQEHPDLNNSFIEELDELVDKLQQYMLNEYETNEMLDQLDNSMDLESTLSEISNKLLDRSHAIELMHEYLTKAIDLKNIKELQEEDGNDNENGDTYVEGLSNDSRHNDDFYKEVKEILSNIFEYVDRILVFDEDPRTPRTPHYGRRDSQQYYDFYAPLD